MDKPFHGSSELFRQLGLAADEAGIAVFLTRHAPLPGGMALAEATFWTPSQASLLREEIQRDADWAEVVDQLNEALRAKG